ncbi:conserved hypothetical protein [Gloeothece citriformis PCC 7424]|uniref:Uncharacterized protein n=1 Tax=Gloeothece citriformis (strain PCC 7424) TaxID=65393 RepID=B7KGV7_GLOC7|nr:hypothetical protein [Gloeothece citriformis]ACK73444.1 conserved hypothetical protein [Gloeothece citriformis PCC 7424]
MATATLIKDLNDISTEDYCVLGLATCFLKEDGEFHEVQVVEPIPSAALEAILKGIPTSYQFACGFLVGEILAGDTPQVPAHFPPQAQLCDNFVERVIAATRTYKSRPEAQKHIPVGTRHDDLNFSLEKKRVLNAVHVVRTEDNVKQHSHTHQVL